MSDKVLELDDTNQPPPKDDRRERFLERHVLRRKRKVVAQTGMNALRGQQRGDSKQRYLVRLGKVQALLQAADRAALALQNVGSAAQLCTIYSDAVHQHSIVDVDTDPDAALWMLNQRVVAANRIIAASTQASIRDVKARQVRGQIAEHEEIAGDLAAVKRTYLTDGTSERMAKTVPGAAKDQAFMQVLRAIKGLETVKKGVQPDVPVPQQLAGQVKGAADLVIQAAQTFLQQAAQIQPPPVGKALDELNSRRKAAETAIVQARHLAMAVAFDQLPVPTQDAPWDEETQLRATGMRTALAFERGGQQATGLQGLGASTSYWIREKDSDTVGREMKGEDAGRGERMYIFKPTDGEEFPAGSNDRKGAGAIKEALAFGNAQLFAQQTGIDLRVPETGLVSVGQFALEGGDPSQPPSIGSAQRNAGGQVSEMRATDPTILSRVPKEDVHRIALLDIMSLSCDRHDGNIMIDTSDPNTPRMTPIDHGGTLPSRSDFGVLKKRFGGVKDTINGVEIVNKLLMVPSAFEPMDPQMQAQLDKLDPDAMEQGMRRQRDALGNVHPGLNPQDKVGDDSFAMSKRAMMFTKLAAKTLSPAEIQIALAARGEELFDVADNGFAALAQQIIDDQAPKKAGYQEYMALDSSEKFTIVKWLRDNGWALSDADGVNDSAAFLMRDPVNAMKLYKAQRPNPNPIPPIDMPAKPNPQLGNVVPDDNAKRQLLQTIRADFPNFKEPSNDFQWKQAETFWPLIAQDGGGVRFQEAMTATGGVAEEKLPIILEIVQLWQKVRQQNVQNAIIKSKTDTAVTEILRRALAKAASAQRNALMVQACTQQGGQVDDAAARLANVQLLMNTLQPMVVKFKDQGVANGLTQQINAAQQVAQNGNPAGGEKALQDLIPVVIVALRADLGQQFERVKGKIDAIADRKIWPQGMFKDLEMRGLVSNAEKIKAGDQISFIEQYLVGAKNVYRALKNAQDDPNAQQQPVPVQQQNVPDDDDHDDAPTTDDQDDTEEDFENDGNAQDDDNGNSPLSVFDWHESSAKAATAFAYREGMLKKKKTGLGDNVRKVKKARKDVAGIKPTTSARKKRETLSEAIEAYNGFGIFVASRLRGMSGDRRWQDYCNLAAAEVQARINETRQRLEQLG